MSTQLNEKNQTFLEINLLLFKKRFGFTLKINTKIALSILVPIVVKIVSMILNHYGQVCP